MDPGFIFAIADAMQRNQIVRAAIAQAKEEVDDVLRRQKLEETQRAVLAAVQQNTRALQEASSVNPEQVYVRVRVIMHDLDGWRVVPDSFADLKEKEDVALMWSKLFNLIEKCKSLMTPQQIELCDACLEAIRLQNLVRFTAECLAPYEQYQQIAPELERARSKKRNIDRVKTVFWVLFIMLIVATFLVIGLGDRLSSIAVFIWFVTGEVLGIAFIIYLIVSARQMREFRRLESLCQEFANAAHLQNCDFWQAVNEQFGGIPTIEYLTQKWNEQEVIIQKIFGESEDNPSSV